MPPKFFITHSWKDIEFAKRLTDDLHNHGLGGFFDAYSIKPGDIIPKEIQRGLEACDIYVPILSYAALASEWCDEEINAAITLGKMPGRQGRPRIIPLLIENCQDKMSVFLHNRLYINFTNRYDEAFKELLTKGFGIIEIHKAPMVDDPPLGGNPFQPTQSSAQQFTPDSTEEFSQVPVIISATVTPGLITGGGVVRLQMRVRSQAPVNWLNLSLDGPRGNLYGGGGTHNFKEISSGIWESEWVYDISKWAPLGIYTFRNISVKNEAELTSLVEQPISFEVAALPEPKTTTSPPTKVQTPSRGVFNPKDGKEMILIPAGEFVMGSNEAKYDDEKPMHKVHLDAFYISSFPVTSAEYKKFVDTTKHASPSHWSNGKIPQGKENHPVVNVTWNDAVAYCKWADARLPTEAEWEKAASWDEAKHEKRIYPWGNDFDASRCNASESKIGDTTPVDKYSPQGDSPYGIADMAGNVWEWCADWYDENYYSTMPTQNPKGSSSGEVHVLRAGAWNDFYYGDVRTSFRVRGAPIDRVDYVGFRLAKSDSP